MTTELKIKESSCQRLLVVAIDLGTTFSGYVFSLRTEPFDLKCRSTLHHPAAHEWGATTTVLLLDEKKKFVAFGYEAEETYNRLVDKGMHGKYYYCRRFKMSLHTSVIMDINYTIKDFNGKEVEALIVFSESIKYLKNHAEDTNKRIYPFASDEIEWVITIPAMWTDAGKQFMRKAAEKAGIKDEQLKIAIAPEAALCLYRHIIYKETDTTINQVQTDRGFQNGAKILVVDMGDDNVDITLCQVMDETSLQELVTSYSGHWGGMTVDDNFVRFLESIVGKNVFNSLAEEAPYFLIDLYGYFASKKRAFGRNWNNLQDNIRTKMNISVDCLLAEKMREMYPDKNIDDVIEKDDILKGKVTWKNGIITIDSDLFASFFETCLKGTINQIEGVMGNSSDVEAMLLVGSCAEWPLMQKRIKSQFPNKRIIVPEYAEFAVLKGSVIYGHFPTTIVSRVARHSYGIRVYRKFLPGQHPEDKLVVIGTKRKCKDVFAVHVKKGQELRVGEVQSSQRYTRLSAAQKSLIFDFFSSTSENPQYVTDPGCEELGKLEVELDSRSKGVVISLRYGVTEIEAEGIDEVTGKRTTAIFKFLKERDES